MTWAQTFKLLRSLGIDSKELIPPSYEAWRAGTINPIPIWFPAPIDCLKILALSYVTPRFHLWSDAMQMQLLWGKPDGS